MYLNLFTPKILLLPLRTDNHTVLMIVSLEYLFLDPPIIPSLIFFFILISCLLGIVLITMLLICMCYQVVTRGTTRIILIQWGGEVVLVPQEKTFLFTYYPISKSQQPL